MDEPKLIYNPDTDVVQAAFTERVPSDAVAVPGEDLTILVSETLGRVVAIDIQDLPTFVRRYVPERVVPADLHGEELFAAARPYLQALMRLFARNLGPVAKDTIRLWDELAQREPSTPS